MMFTFPKTVSDCSAWNSAGCKGFIDVNGKKGPNRETTEADNPADIYPVSFYDQVVRPNSEAAREVLFSR